ncbi:MAG: sigma-70 family RNA polymerase sigma factor [Myxococcales bacterium]|nr:sigma-70 family RNA polymerase sigma factor [Myxococcales bacterium]
MPGPDTATASDEDLVGAMARGNGDALGRLYDRYAALLLATASRILRHPQRAEDLVHDVLMEAWRKAGSYRRERGSVRTWLLVRLRSRALDRIRSEQRARVDTVPSPPRVVDTVHGDPALNMERAQVRTAVASLPVAQREVLELAYFGGLSSREIAHQLGIPVGTVKSRTAAGLGKLRSALESRSGRHA